MDNVPQGGTSDGGFDISDTILGTSGTPDPAGTGDPLVHNTKGSGLGLSLVRHITQAHGGDIAVESAPGKGSRFILSLPLTSPVRQQPLNA